jgi:hypothetical protein
MGKYHHTLENANLNYADTWGGGCPSAEQKSNNSNIPHHGQRALSG